MLTLTPPPASDDILLIADDEAERSLQSTYFFCFSISFRIVLYSSVVVTLSSVSTSKVKTE